MSAKIDCHLVLKCFYYLFSRLDNLTVPVNVVLYYYLISTDPEMCK